MSATTLMFELQNCPEAPPRPRVAAYVTLTYGDFRIIGLKVVRKGDLAYVMLPKGVSMPDTPRRRAFDEYVLKQWRTEKAMAHA